MSAAADCLRALGQALAAMALYGEAHPARTGAIARADAALRRALAEEGALRVSFLGERIVVGARPLDALARWELGERLAQAGVQRLEVDDAPPPAADDVVALLVELRARLDAPARIGGTWERGALRFGEIAVAARIDDTAAPDDGDDALARLARHGFAEEAALVTRLHAVAAADGRVPMGEATAVVHALAAVIDAQRDVFPSLMTLRTFDEYTTTHSCNVAMLSMGLAERLGLDAREVRAIGVAALLHDVGKVRVPPDILGKKGRLNDEEFARMQAHTIEGARILARERSDMLAAVVAYEHHIHWHGNGGYPRLAFPRTTHYASRIVQVCDIYDAMCTDRPYRRATPPAQALGVLQQGAGPQVDPAIAATFIRFVGDVFGVAPEAPPPRDH